MTTPQIASPQSVAAAAAAHAAALPAQYLTFTLAGETFAIGILAIKEPIEYRGVTEVPKMSSVVRGVINLCGAVVPVLDLLARFGKASSEIGKRTCFVIVEMVIHEERQVIGVMVDAVSEVLDIPATDIEPAPSFGARVGREFIAGMGKVRRKSVILLEVNRRLAAAEHIGALAEAAENATAMAA